MGYKPESYTVLVIPHENKSTLRVYLPSKWLFVTYIIAAVCTLLFIFFLYDYISIARDRAEIDRLRNLTFVQRSQIEELIGKTDVLSVRLQELNYLDRKVRIMANISKNAPQEQSFGIGGPLAEDRRLLDRLSRDHRQTISGIDSKLAALQEESLLREESFREILEIFQKQNAIRAAKPTLWPVTGWVSSEFGYRISPFNNQREFHAAIDIATNSGRQIIAPADGVVIEAAYRPDLGNFLRIDHGRGITTLYGHLLKISLKEGTVVKRGSVIGQVGNSGQSTGPHLHYAVILNGVPVNPRKYLN